MSDRRRRPLALHVAVALDFGGVERQLEILAHAAGDSRFVHAFVALGEGGAAEAAIGEAGAQVRCLGRRSSVYALRTSWALWRLIRCLKPAVVHAHGGEANFHGVLAARAARVPVVLAEEIGIPSHSPLARRVFSVVYRLAARVVAVSAVVKAWLVEAGEAPASRVVVIDNPVRLPGLVTQGGREDGPLRFVFVGRLVPEKGLDLLIEAGAALRAKELEFRLTLVGDGAERDRLLALRDRLGLTAEVEFRGFLPQPAAAVAAADVFVLPSRQEGFCLALVEAMALERPVVSTRVGIAPDVVSEGVNGWLAPPGDAQALAAKMELALGAAREDLRRMGAAARAAVAGRYEPPRYVAEIESLYETLSAERGRGAP